MDMTIWHNDSRIQRFDPIIPYLSKAWNFWVARGYVEPDATFRLAEADMLREQFAMMTKAVINETWDRYAWEAAPYGGHPGGEPYCETYITRPEMYPADANGTSEYVRDPFDDSFVDRKFRIQFGLTGEFDTELVDTWGETAWYVFMDDETDGMAGNYTDLVYLDPAKVTPSVLIGWIELFAHKAEALRIRERTSR